jgi:hypothetical protein
MQSTPSELEKKVQPSSNRTEFHMVFDIIRVHFLGSGRAEITRGAAIHQKESQGVCPTGELRTVSALPPMLLSMCPFICSVCVYGSVFVSLSLSLCRDPTRCL